MHGSGVTKFCLGDLRFWGCCVSLNLRSCRRALSRIRFGAFRTDAHAFQFCCSSFLGGPKVFFARQVFFAVSWVRNLTCKRVRFFSFLRLKTGPNRTKCGPVFRARFRDQKNAPYSNSYMGRNFPCPFLGPTCRDVWPCFGRQM